MKLEIILGFIIGAVFLGGGVFYAVSTKEQTPKDLNSSNAIYGNNGKKQEDVLAPSPRGPKPLSIEEKKAKFPLANEISSPDGFINTDGKPITISEFKGKKVVLLDIWTYSCINCIRTIPHLNELYKKYEDQGLVIIGLHTPEFAFEKIQKNVEDAVKRFDIKYPVVLDNDFSTWNAYGNRYWPRKYLIDIDGYVVYDHIGEGGYEETEKAVQTALLEKSARFGTSMTISAKSPGLVNEIITEASKVESHELYFGSLRNTDLENGASNTSGIQTLTIPTTLKSNQLYLGGTWTITPEYAESSTKSDISLNYKAKNVYLVASSQNGAKVEIFVDGKSTGIVSIKSEMLYTIVSGVDYQRHTLLIKIKDPGVRVFAFTFG